MRLLTLQITAIILLVSSVCATSSQSISTQKNNPPVPAEVAKYIGLRHGPSLPDGLTLIGGALVSEVNDDEAYVLNEVHKGRIKMLWFAGLTHRDGGAPYSEVKDLLVLPPIRKYQVVVYNTCFLHNRPDKEIVAVVAYHAGVQYFTCVYKAWRANRKTEKFEAIPVKGIKCENEGYGV